jgi:hypothetical protein
MTQESSDAAVSQQVQEALIPHCEVEAEVAQGDGAASPTNDPEALCFSDNECQESRNKFEVTYDNKFKSRFIYKFNTKRLVFKVPTTLRINIKTLCLIMQNNLYPELFKIFIYNSICAITERQVF